MFVGVKCVEISDTDKSAADVEQPQGNLTIIVTQCWGSLAKDLPREAVLKVELFKHALKQCQPKVSGSGWLPKPSFFKFPVGKRITASEFAR